MFRKKASKRELIILIALAVCMMALIGKLFQLTVVKGDYYSQLSDSKRTKTIQIPAPRGNIYDTKGRLLAGTRTSFAVQSYKDEFSRLDKKERNQILKNFVLFADQDGVDYLEEYPIDINVFSYPSEEDYFTEEESPQTRAERLLIEKKLVADWLSSYYEDPKEPAYRVSPASRALKFFSMRGHSLPLTIDQASFALSYDEKSSAYASMKSSGNLDPGRAPVQFLADQLEENPNILNSVMNHPAARKLAYDLLSRENLSEKLILKPVVFTYKENFLLKKAALHHSFPEITKSTTAKEDFTTIVRNSSLEAFLLSMDIDQNNSFVIPAEELINSLAGKEKINLTYRIHSDAKSISIEYAHEENTTEEPLDRLIRIGKKYNQIDGLITDPRYKRLAEKAMFSTGVYPGISINNWTYGLKKSQEDYIENFSNQLSFGEKLSELPPEKAFQFTRLKEELADPKEEKNLEKGQDNSLFQIHILDYGILVSLQKVKSQGSYAYSPVNLCYELSQETVAKLEEHIAPDKGLRISRESVRYYPNGEAACHILGYIGKIATEQELKKYVKEKNYLPNEFIGKTGVEESFEDTLHGVPGKEVVRIDSKGNRTEILSRTEPQAGSNVYLTIDLDLQKQAEKSLRNNIVAIKRGMSYQSPWGAYPMVASPSINSGAVISSDPKTGNLLAMASYPGYDPNLFVTGISSDDWKSLQDETNKDPEKPKALLNLNTQTSVQPGSTFKTIVSLAAMDKGLKPKDTINCSGHIELADHDFKCLIYTEEKHGHGPLDLYGALYYSCNYYFYVLGLGMDPNGGGNPGIKVTVDDLQKTEKQLGLDQKSGLEINIPQEATNNIPSREGKLELSKTLLRRFLETELPKYKKPDVSKNPTELEKDIELLLLWSERGKEISRSKLMKDLDAMGYESEKPLKGNRNGLTDLIKYSYFNQIGWTVADSLNTMIGQGQNSYTPISMLTVDNIIANGGIDYDITLIKEIRSADHKTLVFSQKPHGRDVGMDGKHLEDLRKGMEYAAQGLGKCYEGLPFSAASKTGTAQRAGKNPVTGKAYMPYAWIMGFAPANDPQICTVAFLPSGNTSINPAPLIRDTFAKYMEVKASHEFNQEIYDVHPTYIRPQGSEEKGEEPSEARPVE